MNKLLFCVLHGRSWCVFIPVPLQVIFASDKDSGLKNITGQMLAEQNSTTLLLTGLKINTMYDISVRAVTGAGPGENVTGSVSTAEDGERDIYSSADNTYMHALAHTCIYMRAHTHPYTHTFIHSCKHTHHTFMHIRAHTPAMHNCLHMKHTPCMLTCVHPSM